MSHNIEISKVLGDIERIHFVGIGGAGMSGIAEVLSNLGYQVSGSDLKASAITEHLQAQGVKIYLGHHQNHIENTDVVVISNAIDRKNPEIERAYRQRIPVIPRAEMLAELMRFRFGIAIAGTHGKTTTTSLVASILAEADLDPTFVIGGKLNSSGTHAKLGTGHYLVAEADESDASFLYLQPMIAVVTNIDQDHLETYQDNFQHLKKAFVEFLHHLPFYGRAVICLDDQGAADILADLSKPVTTYGVHEQADIRAVAIKQQGLITVFTVLRKQHSPLQVTLNMPGWHNMLNALAAIAVASHLKIKDQSIVKSLATFKGIGRRFQIQGDIPMNTGVVTLVDDYGHHPCEITATLEGLHQAWPKRRAVVIFQPHRYTRTRDLFEDFVQVLSTIDVLILLDIYAAGEAVIANADGKTLSRAIRTRGQVDPIFVKNEDDLLPILKAIIQTNDVILTLGAGSVGQIADQLPKQLTALLNS
jgi:UDP-N-acetylmuramate--alanine ligase